MPSIIEGYNYDIFISCRQNDNKYDGWVTEFAVNLNKELEATINENFEGAYKLVKEREKSGRLNLGELNQIGYAYWQVDKHKEAESYFSQQIKYSKESIKPGRNSTQTKSAQYNLASTYAFLGEKSMAYFYLDELNKSEFYPLLRIILIKHDPMFESIRNEERFQKILHNMEAKYQAEHERVKKWLEENNMF